VYLLVGTNTNHKNDQPTSRNIRNTVSTPVDIDATEAQFQISFKSKLWDNIFGDNGSLWAGYTQSSRWQIYNDKNSRPFRETNYEPEFMFVMKTPFELAGWQGRMSSIAINHQSNGRASPLSRSWNRVIAQVGLEKDDTMVLIRPWWRIPEKDKNDDNPHIQDYVGRGEVVVAQRFGEHVVSLQARHSLRFGDDSRGSAKLEWAIPISGKLKAHLSLFSGYGESLIDFNHRQTMVGAGISLVEWR
jgi:phospholipase A1/A2